MEAINAEPDIATPCNEIEPVMVMLVISALLCFTRSRRVHETFVFQADGRPTLAGLGQVQVLV